MQTNSTPRNTPAREALREASSSGEASSFPPVLAKEQQLSAIGRVKEDQPHAAANLDALRALAVLLVLFDHVADTIAHKSTFSIHPYDWAVGRLGVLLFFVHTSLVLNLSMQRLRSSGWSLMQAFFIRRAFRLFPLSIVCVLAVVTLHVPAMPWEDYVWKGWGNLLSNLALTTNLTFSRPLLGPLWSLPIEAQMYVTLPFIFLALRFVNRRVVLILVIWMLALGCAVLQPRLSDRLNVIGFSPFFISGVVAFVLADRVKGTFSGLYWLPFLIFLLGVYLAIATALNDMYNVPLQAAFCLCVGLAIPRFQQSKQPLLNSVSHQIANYSYGIYLFHCIAIWFGCFVLAKESPLTQWLVAISTLSMATYACFHLIEKPAINYGARLSSRLSRNRR